MAKPPELEGDLSLRVVPEVDSPLPKSQRKLQRNHNPFSYWLQWMLVLSIVTLSLYVCASGAPGGMLDGHRFLMLVTIAFTVFTYNWMGIFRRSRSLVGLAGALAGAWTLVVLELVIATKLVGLPSALGLPGMMLWVLVCLVAQVLLLSLSHMFFEALRGSGASLRSPVVVVGRGDVALRLLGSIERNPYLSEKVVGVVDDAPRDSVDGAIGKCPNTNLPLLGDLGQLAKVVANSNADKVYLALPFSRMPQIASLQDQLQLVNTDVVWVPDVTALTLLNPSVKEISGLPLISLSEGPLNSIGSAYVKSLFDVTVACTLLLLLSPIMLVIALAVKLTSMGPVFYSQPRHGWDGSVFDIWKFRSMYEHTEAGGKISQAKKGDRRVTPLGRFLRRTSLDELPQLFNVLNGTMSMVGPRPHSVVHNFDYARKINRYMTRHRIKPGITGFSQVNGLRGETETLEKMQRRVAHDLEYINNWSIWLDLIILAKTPYALFTGKGAY